MVNKLILICLIGFLGIVGLPSSAGAYGLPSSSLWLAQTETVPQTIPAEQPSPESEKDKATPPAADQTQSEPAAPADRSPSATERSPSKPSNPYDMEALRRFDAGDHRSN